MSTYLLSIINTKPDHSGKMRVYDLTDCPTDALGISAKYQDKLQQAITALTNQKCSNVRLQEVRPNHFITNYDNIVVELDRI